MRRFQMMLDERLDEDLEVRAAQERVSKAELLRRFARQQLARPLPPLEEDPIWGLGEVGEDRVQDAYTGRESEHVDDVLYGQRA